MILECPECHARFLVADALLAPAGRTVRCGACAHRWHAGGGEPSAEAPTSFAEAVAQEMEASGGAAPEIAPTQEPAAAVPLLQKLAAFPVLPFKIAAPVLALLALVLAYFAYGPHFAHGAMEGLQFENVQMEPKNEEEKTSFVLSGSIVNHGADLRTIPTVRVTLRNADGDRLWEREYVVNKSLKAGGTYPFKIANADTTRGAEVALVELDVGTSTLLRARR